LNFYRSKVKKLGIHELPEVEPSIGVFFPPPGAPGSSPPRVRPSVRNCRVDRILERKASLGRPALAFAAQRNSRSSLASLPRCRRPRPPPHGCAQLDGSRSGVWTINISSKGAPLCSCWTRAILMFVKDSCCLLDHQYFHD
jgi:hypothetical protein